jgi:hypothetical protein
MDNIEYISSSDSDSDSNSELRVMPITELATRRPKRRRLGMNSIFYTELLLLIVTTESATAPGSSFSCSGCNETLKADGRVYFLPFCGCVSVHRSEKVHVLTLQAVLW